MDAYMETWEKLAIPPKKALKEITGGRLKGKTDINPQWRYKAMTETFGQCGVGWKYEITKLWTEPASEGQIFAFAEIALCVATEAGWSKNIPGIGGAMLIAKETNGLYSSDEAFKMAVTDALSVALKMLGVASDVYEGRMNSKYSSQKTQSGSTQSEKPWLNEISGGLKKWICDQRKKGVEPKAILAKLFGKYRINKKKQADVRTIAESIHDEQAETTTN